MTTAAIYYHPEAYTISRTKLMAPNAVGESFLRDSKRYSQTTEHCLLKLGIVKVMV